MLLLLSCGGDVVEPNSVHQAQFVRGGVLDEAGHFSPLAWQPHQKTRWGVAPSMASCVEQFSLILADTPAKMKIAGGEFDTTVVFSPDGQYVVVYDAFGTLHVVSTQTGEAVRTETHPISRVRKVVFGEDGTMYTAFQDVDATVEASDVATGKIKATLKLSQWLKSSALPTDDLFAMYSLPAAYDMAVLSSGELLIVGAHGWNVGKERLNRSVLLRVRADLEVVSQFPDSGAADVVFGAFSATEREVAVSVRRSATGPAPNDLPVHGVLVLNAHTLVPMRQIHFPVEPHFSSVFIWEGLEYVRGQVVAGTADGRVMGEGAVARLATAQPDSNKVPVVAPIGFLGVGESSVFAVTGSTNIPFGAAASDAVPSHAHPGENTLWALSPTDLSNQWVWHGPHTLTGLSISEGWVVVGAGARTSDERQDLFGALVFSTELEDEQHLAAVCHTSGPVHWRNAQGSNGLIAVTQVPITKNGVVLSGEYKLVVFR